MPIVVPDGGAAPSATAPHPVIPRPTGVLRAEAAAASAARSQTILAAARRLAESEGWPAVTTRRLSAEAALSQPMLYKHFERMDDIAHAVALQAFGELAAHLRAARTTRTEASTEADAEPPTEPGGEQSGRDAVARLAHAFLEFTEANPALHDAMLLRPASLRADDGSRPAPFAALLAELSAALPPAPEDAQPDDGPEAAAELLWSALVGLALLARAGQLPPAARAARIALLARQLTGTPA